MHARERRETLPVIVLAYGWGGTKANFRAEAAALPSRLPGVLFDYRGGAESDGPHRAGGSHARARSNAASSRRKVRELREVMDPPAGGNDSQTHPLVQEEPQADSGSCWGLGTQLRRPAQEMAVAAAARPSRSRPCTRQMGAGSSCAGTRSPGPAGRTIEDAAASSAGQTPSGRVSGSRARDRREFHSLLARRRMKPQSGCALQLVRRARRVFDIRASIAATSLRGAQEELVVLPDAHALGRSTSGARADGACKLALAWF